MSYRPDEVHAIPDTNFARDCLEALLLAFIAFLAVLAEDQQAHIVVAAVAQQGQSANRNLHALEPLQSADEQEEAAAAVPDLPARVCAVHRLEHRKVDSGRHDGDALRIG